MNKFPEKLSFKKVNEEKFAAQFLYHLLAKRRYGISHRKMPSYNEHLKFIKNHPYRIWVLILIEDICIGSFYLTKDNAIGLFLIDDFISLRLCIISKIINSYKPLRAKKSVRPPYFYFNVASEDEKFNEDLVQYGCERIQTTFKVSN